MQHLSLFLGVLASVFALLMIVLVGVVLTGHLRKAVTDAAEQVGRVWKSRAEAAEAELLTARQGAANFEERFSRLEAEAMLRDRKLEMFDRKCGYHDNVIRIIISVKARIPADAMESIDALLKEMVEYVDKAEIEMLSLKQSQVYFDRLRRRDFGAEAARAQGEHTGDKR